MISPLKDIVIAVSLGVGGAMVWQNFKNNEMDRISRYYKWLDAQPKSSSLHDDDE